MLIVVYGPVNADVPVLGSVRLPNDKVGVGRLTPTLTVTESDNPVETLNVFVVCRLVTDVL